MGGFVRGIEKKSKGCEGARHLPDSAHPRTHRKKQPKINSVRKIPRNSIPIRKRHQILIFTKISTNVLGDRRLSRNCQ